MLSYPGASVALAAMEDSTQTGAKILPPAVFKWAHAGVLAMQQQQQQQQQSLKEDSDSHRQLGVMNNTGSSRGNRQLAVEEGDQVSRALFDRINDILSELHGLKHGSPHWLHPGD